jgi:hypothetical protein
MIEKPCHYCELMMVEGDHIVSVNGNYAHHSCAAGAGDLPVIWCKDTSILLEAEHLTEGARNADYGHPLDDYRRTAKLWSAVLGIDVTPEQAMLCMICVKISRECNHPKRDNRVDGAGYFKCLDMAINERIRRGE